MSTTSLDDADEEKAEEEEEEEEAGDEDAEDAEADDEEGADDTDMLGSRFSRFSFRGRRPASLPPSSVEGACMGLLVVVAMAVLLRLPSTTRYLCVYVCVCVYICVYVYVWMLTKRTDQIKTSSNTHRPPLAPSHLNMMLRTRRTLRHVHPTHTHPPTHPHHTPYNQ